MAFPMTQMSANAKIYASIYLHDRTPKYIFCIDVLNKLANKFTFYSVERTLTNTSYALFGEQPLSMYGFGNEHTITWEHKYKLNAFTAAFTPFMYFVCATYMHFAFTFSWRNEKKNRFRSRWWESFSRRRLRASAPRSWLFQLVWQASARAHIAISKRWR